MNINGINVTQESDNHGNMIICINNLRIGITPDIMARGWEIQESKDFEQLFPNGSAGWQKIIYDYILSNPNKNNVFLISGLLSVE